MHMESELSAPMESSIEFKSIALEIDKEDKKINKIKSTIRFLMKSPPNY